MRSSSMTVIIKLLKMTVYLLNLVTQISFIVAQ